MSDHRTRSFGPYKAVYKPQGFWSVSLMGDEVGGFSPLAGYPSIAFLEWIEDYEKRKKCSYLPRKTIVIPREHSMLDWDEDYRRRNPLTPWTNRVEVIDCKLEIEDKIA